MMSEATVSIKNLPRKRAVELVLAGLILLFTVFYLAVTNREAKYSFTIKQLQAKRAALSEEIRALTWETGQARSVSAVGERANGLALTAPAAVSFLRLPDTVAQANAAVSAP